MASPAIGFTLSACAAAVGCAFSLGASAQSVDIAMNAARAGLERAITPPLEVVWLQADVQDKMWRDPSLAHVLQGCTRTGAPKEGCAVTVRSVWRYTFDADSAVRPAAIVISSPHLRQAPSGSARLNLTGSGRVYIVTPHATGTGALRPPSGAILLAAGTAVQLVDVAYPSIQVEIKAPDDEGLFLGNLAEADVTKVVALLVKQPGLLSASAASILENGKVALHAPASGAGNTQLAAIAPVKVAAVSEPVLSGNFAWLAHGMEVASPLPASFAVASVDLSQLAGKLDMPVRGVARITPEPVLDQDFTPLVAAMERSEPLPAPLTVATIDLASVAGRLEMPLRDLARVVAKPQPVLDQDFTPLVTAMERSEPLPAPLAVASIDFASIAGRLEVPVRDLARVPAEPRPVLAQDVALVAAALEKATPLPAAFTVAAADFSATAGALEMPAPVTPSSVPAPATPARVEPAKAPVQVAMASAAPAAGAAELARMRAEVEAEVARERERMAQSLQGRSAPRFRFGT